MGIRLCRVPWSGRGRQVQAEGSRQVGDLLASMGRAQPRRHVRYEALGAGSDSRRIQADSLEYSGHHLLRSFAARGNHSRSLRPGAFDSTRDEEPQLGWHYYSLSGYASAHRRSGESRLPRFQHAGLFPCLRLGGRLSAAGQVPPCPRSSLFRMLIGDGFQPLPGGMPVSLGKSYDPLLTTQDPNSPDAATPRAESRRPIFSARKIGKPSPLDALDRSLAICSMLEYSSRARGVKDATYEKALTMLTSKRR